jgi:hypothetical protein
MPAPVQGTLTITPLTLPYGQQPPGLAPQTILSTPGLDWPTQTEPESAAWNVPAVAPSSVAYRRDSVYWIPDTWSAESAAPVAPLTLAYGQQPIAYRRDPVPWTVLDWSAQTATTDAAWNTPTVVGPAPPLRRDPVAWIPLDWPAQESPEVAPLTPVSGQPPPLFPLPRAPWLNVDWAPQAATLSAAWNFPIAAAQVPYRRDAGVGWAVEWATPMRPGLAVLTLPSGQQPPPWWWWTGPTLVATWVVDWAAQRGPIIVPLTLAYGQQPPGVQPPDVRFVLPWVLDWLAQAGPATAGWKLSTVVVKTAAIAFVGIGRWGAAAPKPNYIGGSYGWGRSGKRY